MKNEILFKESQKFKQWWLWLILIGLNLLLIYGTISQVFMGLPFGNNPMSNAGIIVVTGVILFSTVLFLNFRLDTIIKSDGIYVRFFPIQMKYKHYHWKELTKSYVRKYSPITEYGGWGLRLGFGGQGTAFNTSGNRGLQLEFTNNKKLLIGTNKPEELTETLIKIGQLKQ
jgi:hypothetical protein